MLEGLLWARSDTRNLDPQLRRGGSRSGCKGVVGGSPEILGGWDLKRQN